MRKTEWKIITKTLPVHMISNMRLHRTTLNTHLQAAVETNVLNHQFNVFNVDNMGLHLCITAASVHRLVYFCFVPLLIEDVPIQEFINQHYYAGVKGFGIKNLKISEKGEGFKGEKSNIFYKCMGEEDIFKLMK